MPVLRKAPNVVRNTMLTLPTNSWNIVARCFSLTLATVFGLIFFNHGLSDSNNGHIIFWKIKTLHIFYLVLALITLFAFTVTASIFGIIKVQVDKTIDTIAFISFLNKRTIATSDIETYFTTTHRNQFKEWQGILLQTKNNETFQLAGQNLKSLKDFEKYLIDKSIPFSGDRRMKFPFN